MTKLIDSERRKFLTTGVAAGGAGMLGLAGCETTGVASGLDSADAFVIPAPDTISLEVAGQSARFPVRRVYCLGRNFRAHAFESGDNPDENPPFYFHKPTDAIHTTTGEFAYPVATEKLKYEGEMVVALKSGGSNIPEATAGEHVYGYGIGLDMTRWDLQDAAKALERPWEPAKSFDFSAPCSKIHPVSKTGVLTSARIWLSIDGEMRQDSDISRMIWNIPKAIAMLSQHFELKAGDVIMTGTPEGVGTVERGQTIRTGVDGVDEIEVLIT